MADLAIQTVDVSCVPHHNTITASGKSHFSRVSDALAEFIDNSIQACRQNKVLRDIGIVFFLRANLPSFVCIADNGSGMNQKELEEFATYSLDRKTRGLIDERDPSGISKFGVGAKQAGFYLGDRMRVITKSSTTENVMELVLDEHEFKERYESNKEDAFKAQIKIRPAGDKAAAAGLVPEEEKNIASMQEFIKKHEERNVDPQCSQFTVIIIRLREEIATQLMHRDREVFVRARYNNIPAEIAEIYHFHMHPEHQPSEIVKLPKFKESAGLISG
jgi:Histidine kinase-, DNA gyrase B-, and HSP90-like ATPase